jgi:hypothetical protein
MESSKAWFDRVNERRGPGSYAFLSQSLSGNGVTGVVGHQGFEPEPARAITVTLKTQATFYHGYPFYTAQNFLVFRHTRLTEASAMPLLAALRKQMEKFSWGYGVSMARLRRTPIVVPVTTDGSVDWDALEGMGTELLRQVSRRVPSPSLVPVLGEMPVLTFVPRLITEVFASLEASKAAVDGVRLTLDGDASFPYVSRSREDNGVARYVPEQSSKPNAGRAIAVGLDTQTVSYQALPFYTSQNIQVLRHPSMNEASALVLSAIVKKQLAKFSWGSNGATLGRLRRTQIMVPVTRDGAIDWPGLEALGGHLLSVARVQCSAAMAAWEGKP